MTIAKKNDFVGLKYTGYANGEMFDSNLAENLKKLGSNAKAEDLVIVVGQGMVVPGLDKAIEGKEVGKEYEISLTPKEGFGERKRELVRIIPLRMFHEKEVDPKPGMVFTLDNMLVRIITVSGARVTADFNNPMAGKNLKYLFKIDKIVENEHEKVHVVFEKLFGIKPEHEITPQNVMVKGPKQMEYFVNAFNEKFKELIGKPLKFELKEELKGKPKSNAINRENASTHENNGENKKEIAEEKADSE